MGMKFTALIFVALWHSWLDGTTAYTKNEGFYNIAHMTNNIESVDWAMQQGANSVEIDLQFTANGTPYNFRHSPTCDCSCMCPAGGCHIAYPNSVCVQLEKTSTKPCNANTDAKKLLKHIASKPGMAMVLIDSKLTDDGKAFATSTLQYAGKQVFKLLVENLFKQGFNGEVVIGGPGFTTYKYIETIAKIDSPYKDRIHFSIDWENMNAMKQILDFPYNKNVVYNAGLTACSPQGDADFETSKLALLNRVKGVFGMTYTWTVDRWDTMSYYINYFDGIITNYPGSLAKLLKQKKIKTAVPSSRIPPASLTKAITSTTAFLCECTYYSGGCKVTKKAPPEFACQCTYPFLWTCSGWVVKCWQQDSTACRHPDISKASCLQGRGDCGGY